MPQSLAVSAPRHNRALADAIVDTVREPLVVLDQDLRVVSASRSFYRDFGGVPASTEGRLFYELADGQWKIPALRRLLEEVIPRHRTVEAYEIEHEFAVGGRRTLLLNAREVIDDAHPRSALLLAIEDVTARRASEREKEHLLQEKERLLQEKEMLLEEMRHRIANSLQIIASILMLKARTVQSEETRHHLEDAHQRVMSVATVQEQLRVTGFGETIQIAPYLKTLTERLAKSMISDERAIVVVVEAGPGTAVSSDAVSIGLIVTELLINAVKHAFPGDRSGTITVSYAAEGAGWRLSVADDGVGRERKDGSLPVTGLGTSIIEALVRQFDAHLDVASGPQGMTVTVIRDAPPAR